MGRCSNLLNTWKVCCRLVLGIWKPLAKHHFPCSRSHHLGKSCLQVCLCWKVMHILEASSPALLGLQPPSLTLGEAYFRISLWTQRKFGVFGFRGWALFAVSEAYNLIWRFEGRRTVAHQCLLSGSEVCRDASASGDSFWRIRSHKSNSAHLDRLCFAAQTEPWFNFFLSHYS